MREEGKNQSFDDMSDDEAPWINGDGRAVADHGWQTNRKIKARSHVMQKFKRTSGCKNRMDDSHEET